MLALFGRELYLRADICGMDSILSYIFFRGKLDLEIQLAIHIFQTLKEMDRECQVSLSNEYGRIWH